MMERRMIRGITDRPSRMPRVGKLRMGERSKERRGAPIAYWHFEARDDGGITPESASAAFEEVYPGGQPEEIEVMFPLDDESVVFPIHYERWTSGSKCICRGDGYKADLLNRETGELEQIECNPKTCPYYERGECKHVGRMFFLLPKVKGLGVWQLDTRGWNCFQNVLGMIDFLKGITQAQTGRARFAMIPLRLSIRPHDALVEGKTKTVPVLHMSYPDHSFSDVLANLPAPVEALFEGSSHPIDPAALVSEAAYRLKRIESPLQPMTDEEAAAEKANLFGDPEPVATKATEPVRTAESIREQVQAEIADLKKRYNGKAGNPASDKQLDYLRSLICKAEPDDQKRHSVLAYLVGKTSTKDLTQAEASALISWLKGEDGGLKADGAAEAALCLTARLKEAGQRDLFGEEETNGTA